MKIFQKGFELPKLEYYKTHLRIINALFPVNITDKEIEILASFLSLSPEITKDNMFNSFARKQIIESLSLTNGGMSNHIKNMKNKGFIKRTDDSLFIVPALLPDSLCQGYNLKIKIKDE